MPYSVDKDQGGDSKENTGWMENCVAKVEKTGKSKPSAIAICKVQMKKSKDKKSEDGSSRKLNPEEEIFIDAEIISRYTSFREQWIRKNMQTGKTFLQSSNLFEQYLSLNNYII